jgi:F420-dependent oxidoreductase-like protein
MQLAIMIEGQNGLNWTRWRRIVSAIEELGFDGLFRSDHYTNANPPDMDSLELWVSLTWLACNTTRVVFGPLVTPVSFRHPTMTARMAAAVDDLSGGRLTLGLGAGWQEREHTNYGWDLLPVNKRMDRFEEGVKIITQLLSSHRPVNHQGNYYRLNDAVLLPRPQRPKGPPILIGGNGVERTLPLVAKYASEWNGVMISADQYKHLNDRLDELIAGEGRDPKQVKRSIMINFLHLGNQAELNKKISSSNKTIQDYQSHGAIFGSSSNIIDQLGEFANAGAQMVMLQYLDLDNLTDLETLAAHVLPQAGKL